MGHLLRIEKWAENLDEVTVSLWLKHEGDLVEVGESICELISDKATFEYEAEHSGILLSILAAEKSVVPVGYVIGFVGTADETVPEGVVERNEELLAAHQAAAAVELDLDIAPRRSGSRVQATPAARRVAREASVDLEDVAAWLGEKRTVNDRDVQEYLKHVGEGG